ncbi:hypothetical protein [Amycolatopsis albispora]|uniref:hypothetical protein n=1 Tax=Amycolatopsis albispora TaxID=1804986 RepID=UPI0013B35B37
MEELLRQAAFGDDPGAARLLRGKAGSGSGRVRLLAGIVAGAEGRYAAAATLFQQLMRGADRVVAAHAAAAFAAHRRQLGGHAAALAYDGLAVAWATAALGKRDERDPDGLDAEGALADGLLGLAADNLGLGRLKVARLLRAKAGLVGKHQVSDGHADGGSSPAADGQGEGPDGGGEVGEGTGAVGNGRGKVRDERGEAGDGHGRGRGGSGEVSEGAGAVDAGAGEVGDGHGMACGGGEVGERAGAVGARAGKVGGEGGEAGRGIGEAGGEGADGIGAARGGSGEVADGKGWGGESGGQGSGGSGEAGGQAAAGPGANPVAGWRAQVRAGWVGAEIELAAGDAAAAVAPAARAARLARERGALRHSIKSDLVLGTALAAVGDSAGRERALDLVRNARLAADKYELRSLTWPAALIFADLVPANADLHRSRADTVLHAVLLRADPGGRRLARESPWVPV